jgi:hypothetical protein
MRLKTRSLFAFMLLTAVLIIAFSMFMDTSGSIDLLGSAGSMLLLIVIASVNIATTMYTLIYDKKHRLIAIIWIIVAIILLLPATGLI